MLFRNLLSFFLLLSISLNSYSIGWGTLAKAVGYTVIAPFYIEYKVAETMVKGTVATANYLTKPDIVTQLENKYSHLISTLNYYQSSSKHKLREKLLSNIGYVGDYINMLNHDIYSLDSVNHSSAKELQQRLGSIRNVLALYV